jgi:hypothetical protein
VPERAARFPDRRLSSVPPTGLIHESATTQPSEASAPRESGNRVAVVSEIPVFGREREKLRLKVVVPHYFPRR